jgi:hypothetical protein
MKIHSIGILPQFFESCNDFFTKNLHKCEVQINFTLKIVLFSRREEEEEEEEEEKGGG